MTAKHERELTADEKARCRSTAGRVNCAYDQYDDLYACMREGIAIGRAESRTAEREATQQGAVAWRWCETKFGGEDWRYSETGPNPHRLCEPLYLAPPTVIAEQGAVDWVEWIKCPHCEGGKRPDGASCSFCFATGTQRVVLPSTQPNAVAAATRAAFEKAAVMIRKTAVSIARTNTPCARVTSDTLGALATDVLALADALLAEAPEGREMIVQSEHSGMWWIEHPDGSITGGFETRAEAEKELAEQRSRAASPEAAQPASPRTLCDLVNDPDAVHVDVTDAQPAVSEREVELPPLPQRIGGWGLTEITMFRAKAGRDEKRAAFEALLTHVQSKSIPLGDTQWIGLRDALLKAFDAALAQATPQAPEGEK